MHFYEKSQFFWGTSKDGQAGINYRFIDEVKSVLYSFHDSNAKSIKNIF